MKTRNYLLVVLTLFLFFVYACNKESDSSNKNEVSKLSVEEAKTFFENSLQKIVQQSSLSRSLEINDEIMPRFTGLTPVNLTPEWNNAIVTSDEYTNSVNIPITTLEKYYAQGKSSKKMISLSQKMVISQEKDADVMTCWIVTLLPTDGKSSQSQINSFNLSQENLEFSGIVLYTTLNGTIDRIERYEVGIITEIANAPLEHHEGKTTPDLLSDYDFFKNDPMAKYSSSEGGGTTEPKPFCLYCGKMLRYCDCTHHNNPNKSYADCPICFPTLYYCSYCKTDRKFIGTNTKYCSVCGHSK